MPLITRTDKGSPLSIAEMDGNLDYCSPGTYLEVDILMGVAGVSGILGMGTVPIELLPTPGVGKYYEWRGIAEYTHVTTGYTVTDDVVGILGSNSYGGQLMHGIIEGNSSRLNEFASNGPVDNDSSSGTLYYGSQFRETNESLIITMLNGTDPTLGDGTLKVKIWYTVRTFG